MQNLCNFSRVNYQFSWDVRRSVYIRCFFKCYLGELVHLNWSSGDLKKMLMGPTGLHHQDQKLIYKDKERDSIAFLDIVGVEDRSKIVLVVDLISQERRLLEMRRTAKMEKASECISDVSLEVDRLAGQVRNQPCKWK